MVDIFLQGERILYRVNRDEGDDRLCLSYLIYPLNAIFQKYSKEGRSSSSHVGI